MYARCAIVCSDVRRCVAVLRGAVWRGAMNARVWQRVKIGSGASRCVALRYERGASQMTQRSPSSRLLQHTITLSGRRARARTAALQTTTPARSAHWGHARTQRQRSHDHGCQTRGPPPPGSRTLTPTRHHPAPPLEALAELGAAGIGAFAFARHILILQFSEESARTTTMHDIPGSGFLYPAAGHTHVLNFVLIISGFH